MRRRVLVICLAVCFLMMFVLTLAGSFVSSPSAFAQEPPPGLLAQIDDVVDEEFVDEDEEEAEDEEAEDEEDEGEFEEEQEEEEDDDDEFFDEEELELEHRHLEMEMAELELRARRLELVSHVAEVAEDEVRAAAFALTHIMEFFEPDEAIDFLEESLEETESAGVRRVVHMKLAELYAHTDQPEEAKEHLRRLITE